MSKRFLITLITLLLIIAGAGIAIALTKGYTFSSKEGRLVGTGIISVTSLPDGASVYIDGHLATATNANISNLPPHKYKMKVIKDGFIPWEKQVEVKEGVVSAIKITLFPALPTIYPLTHNGVVKPILSPDGQKLAFTVPFTPDNPLRQKGGLWVWTMTSQPIAFNRNAGPRQLVASVPSLDFAQASYRWSPDSKQLFVTMQESNLPGDINKRSFLLSFESSTSVTDLKDITPMVDSVVKGWEEDQKVQEETRALLIDDLKLKEIATHPGTLKWSPDETKFIIGSTLATPSPTAKAVSSASAEPAGKRGMLKGYRVYDLEERQYYDLPQALAYYWLPESTHIILVQEDKIGIVEFDGSNVAEIYAGKFEPEFVFPWPDSSRLVVLTSFATSTASSPNLFGVNLK
ncbi:MAG: hypothetical protein UU73_C0007G0002 [Candidatus Daviesbacteria bacterium GW2011_GWA1_41_61]|uniref:PEGA domain-containing protein n=1 Tax=Candidatus Daviesbacteria bacterium GW2011_GWA2_40_9 TaxID=1618424 RepID=A0A0G0U3H7_9BACT|nr:MAG: hypothetical protein UU26_C0021G0010 [Candidatus Daviesbacteria bacterium GW2011_GWC1_40_9]KKR83609.1 MAG: hypothetical protein UU29_C0003G0011 [Candidatus Daviesbacteria bacterium GW2011_GWA2_40_9]KKR92735.1 MAG: hypothetical protein UU44_C0005G0065 [Candidatus Daviesbacteria bacterium GW2011_GWB1_41_15]KKS14495.1 MAG: hypothetical protein UU73_C0007G0002 [Candidatus Daviesbacteria bacterium GW2011_GWA1_41_61]